MEDGDLMEMEMKMKIEMETNALEIRGKKRGVIMEGVKSHLLVDCWGGGTETDETDGKDKELGLLLALFEAVDVQRASCFEVFVRQSKRFGRSLV